MIRITTLKLRQKPESHDERITSLSWGRLKARSNKALVYWLGHIVELWATHLRMIKAQPRMLAQPMVIRLLKQIEHSSDADVAVHGLIQELIFGIKQLADAITTEELDFVAGAFTIDVSNSLLPLAPCTAEDNLADEFKSSGVCNPVPGFTVSYMTVGIVERYMMVSYVPIGTPFKVYVDWWTGTGRESTTMRLPSEAKKFVELDMYKDESELRPVANHCRMACAILGLPVAHIPIQGPTGVKMARQALAHHYEALLSGAQKQAIYAGADSDGCDFHPENGAIEYALVPALSKRSSSE